MPFGNGTGPAGMGPMTGRGRGYCVVPVRPAVQTWATGLGRGMGRGMGRGFGRGFGLAGWGYAGSEPYGPVVDRLSSEDEKAALKESAAALRRQLEIIEKRLSESD